jgi:hypothetical protein
MIEILRTSLDVIQKKWTVHLFMYLVGLLLTIVPTFFFYQILEKETGSSILLNELVPDFSFMVLGDFLNASFKAFKPVFWYGIGMGFLGSIVYTFFAGGIIDQLTNPNEKFTIDRFFKQSAALFPKYFGVLILIGILLFVFFLVAGLVYFIFVSIADGSTERGYVLWLTPPTIFLSLLMIYGLCVSFYAKVFLYKEPKLGFVKAFWEAFYYVFRERMPLLLFLVTIGVSGVLLLLYLGIDKFIGMQGGLSIGIMFIIQQVFIWSKFVLKHWNYALALQYFEQHKLNLPQFVKSEVVNIAIAENSPHSSNIFLSDSEESKLSEPEEGS